MDILDTLFMYHDEKGVGVLAEFLELSFQEAGVIQLVILLSAHYVCPYLVSGFI